MFVSVLRNRCVRGIFVFIETKFTSLELLDAPSEELARIQCLLK
jgi:hypothetical protein